MIMCRYADIDNFNKMPLSLGIKLIYKCLYELERRKAWDIWIALYPRMTKDNFMPFEKFFGYKSDDIVPKEHKSVEDMLKTAEDISGKMAAGRFKEVKM